MSAAHDACPTAMSAGVGHALVAYDAGLGKMLLVSGDAEAPRIVSFAEIVGLLEQLIHPKTLQNQREAYHSFSAKNASVMPVQTLGQPPYGRMHGGDKAQVCVKTGYVHGDSVYVVKIAGGGAAGFGNTGCLQVFSQKSLRLSAILQDEGLLTEVRTAAATCLVSSLFLPAVVSKIGLVGAGPQAVWQLRFLSLVTTCRKVVLKTSCRETAAAFVEKMRTSAYAKDREWQFELAEDIAAPSFRGCVLIHTLTTSRAPVLAWSDLFESDADFTSESFKGLHISAVGADSPGKQELELSIVERADLRVCDCLRQTAERGEFQEYLQKMGSGRSTAAGDAAGVVEIGQLLAGDRADLGDFTAATESGIRGKLSIFDTSGIAVQDVCIAKLVCEILNVAL